jgi:hypothetical protein
MNVIGLVDVIAEVLDLTAGIRMEPPQLVTNTKIINEHVTEKNCDSNGDGTDVHRSLFM